MLNRLKEAMQTTLDTLAPPPPLHEDFVYHWKRFMKHYLNLSFEDKAAVELTNLPACLNRLREILVNEDQQLIADNNSELGSCMEYLLQNDLLNLLVTLAISDEPPGMKQCILRFFSKTLTQLKKPNIVHSALYVPLTKLMNVCDGLLHTVCESEEIEFLLHLSSVLRKQSEISIIFFSDDNIKNLIEATDTGDLIKYTNILDLILSYVDSADSAVRVKACQCIMLVCSTDNHSVAKCIVDNFKFNHFLIGRLITLFYDIPVDDYEKFKNIESSWTLDTELSSQLQYIKNRQAITFFNWLDFINQLCVESHELIKNDLQNSITRVFLEEAFKLTNLRYPETITLLYKYYISITAPLLLTGFHNWLVAESVDADVPEISTNPILKTLIDNCTSEIEFEALTSLEFFAEVLNKCDQQVLYCLVLCYLKDRHYYDAEASVSSWSDEEDEREKYSSSPEALSTSRTLAPSNIDKIIQSFVNLLPSQIRTRDSEENVTQLQNHYEQIINHCSNFEWPTEATSDIESISNDSSPEVDSYNKKFYEGPFLRMIFTKLRNISRLSYSQMLQVSAIVTKLSMLPHPFLHEYFLNPFLPLRNGVKSLYYSLQYAMNDVNSRIQIIIDFQNELKNTRERIIDGNYDLKNRTEIDRYLEACVILEELCNELAAIIYVKCTHFRKKLIS